MCFTSLYVGFEGANSTVMQTEVATTTMAKKYSAFCCELKNGNTVRKDTAPKLDAITEPVLDENANQTVPSSC